MKKMALFEDLVLGLLTKYTNFFGVCSILAKKVTNFDPPKQKLNNLTDTDMPIIYISILYVNMKNEDWKK